MKNIALLLALVIGISLFAQENKQNIQNKGTLTIIKNGQKHEYVFDVDTALINGKLDTNLNEMLENLNASFDVHEADTMLIDVNAHTSQTINLNDTTTIIVGKNEIVVVEGNEKTTVNIGNKDFVRVEERNDTVEIKIGKKVMRVVENKDGSVITFDDTEEDVDIDFDWDWDCGKKKNKDKFKGHYGLMEFGVNTFTNPDYSMYLPEENNFMDLDHNRSTEFNLNIFWQSFGLQKNKGSIGLVTGLGFSWNNYFFAKDVTIAQGDQMVEPIFTKEEENYGYVEKTKLMVSYLTIPLLFEFHLTQGKNPLYISVGGMGAIRLGSHTKIKHGGNKDKDFSDFYLAPFRYGGTARLGYGSIYLYGTYYASEMFREDRGPKMNPYTIGIGFPAF